MVSRNVPLVRRLRAARGRIVLLVVWLSAAGGAAALGFVQTLHPGSIAVAVTRVHPVLAPESGRIATVAVSPGQRVQAGDILATIEIPGLPQILAAADATVADEEAGLRTDDADRNRRFATDLEDARTRLVSARVALEADQATLASLEVEVARQSLPGLGLADAALAIATGQRDAVKATLEARRAEVAALEQALRSAEARASASGAAPGGALAARAERDAIEARLAAATLRAFAGGVVGDVVPVPGQWVLAGLPVVTVSEPTSAQAVLYVDVGRAHQLAPGTPVRVRPPSGLATDAVVRTVGAIVEALPTRHRRDPATPEWGVPITLDVRDRVLVPGEVLAVEF